jgi:hypothetical protein
LSSSDQGGTPVACDRDRPAEVVRFVTITGGQFHLLLERWRGLLVGRSLLFGWTVRVSVVIGFGISSAVITGTPGKRK